MCLMRPKPKTSPEYTAFQGALKRVLQVSKSDLVNMLAQEKIANQDKPKRGPKPKHVSGRLPQIPETACRTNLQWAFFTGPRY
jgi:hypothetical protein